MGHISIAAYRPKEGKTTELLELVKEHIPILRSEGLATDRTAITMRAKDGTILEVFEWVSTEAIDKAHQNPTIQSLWAKFNEVCDYTPLIQLEETKDLFAGFEPVDL